MTDFEVVWNGAIERQTVAAAWREPPPAVPAHGPPSHISAADNLSERVCDRILVYLLDHPTELHTTMSVAKALRIDNNGVSVMLTRFERRGILELAGYGVGMLARQRIYRVCPKAVA